MHMGDEHRAQAVKGQRCVQQLVLGGFATVDQIPALALVFQQRYAADIAGLGRRAGRGNRRRLCPDGPLSGGRLLSTAGKGGERYERLHLERLPARKLSAAGNGASLAALAGITTGG